MIADYDADGVVFHPIKSCRTVSTGLADSRRSLLSKLDTATLFIESDHMDRRVVSEAQLKNRVDAFFEGLATRKRQSVIAATARRRRDRSRHLEHDERRSLRERPWPTQPESTSDPPRPRRSFSTRSAASSAAP